MNDVLDPFLSRCSSSPSSLSSPMLRSLLIGRSRDSTVTVDDDFFLTYRQNASSPIYIQQEDHNRSSPKSLDDQYVYFDSLDVPLQERKRFFLLWCSVENKETKLDLVT